MDEVIKEKKENSKELNKINKILDSINKKVNKGTSDDTPMIFVASDRLDLITPQFIPTNVEIVNEKLGGGFPRKAITLLSGPEGSGKTALAFSAAVHELNRGKYVVYVCAETAFPWQLAKDLNVNLERLIILDPKNYGEQIIDAIFKILVDTSTGINNAEFSLVVVDSITAMVPKSMIDKIDEKGSEQASMGNEAKMISQWLSKIATGGMLKESSMILISQQRVDLGAYAAPSTTTGGKAPKYYCKINLELGKKMDYAKVGEFSNFPIGHTVNFTVKKNGLSGYPTKGMYSIIYGQGVNDSEILFTNGVKYKWIVKETAKEYSFITDDSVYVLTGKIADARDYLKQNSELKDFYRKVLKSKKERTGDVPTNRVDITLPEEENE